MIDHGKWTRYVPDPYPEHAPAGALFWRNAAGADWYQWSRQRWAVVGGIDNSQTTKIALVDGVVSCVSQDVTALSIAGDFDLIELEAGEPPPLGWLYHEGQFVAAIPVPDTLDTRRTAALASVNAAAAARLAAGAPVTGGLHVAVDEGSRTDLATMETTAAAATAGEVSWPASYARGWIAVENVRIPLATPAAGLTLAASVGDWYARVIQHRRDLKDQVLAAANEAALDAIDIKAGWPT